MAGRGAAASSDLVVVVHYTTIQAPVLWTVARAARRGARVVAICANVVPHERRPGDRLLTALLMRAVDAAVVHTAAERTALAALTDRPISVAALPPHLPDGPPRPPRAGVRGPLFFGKVRRYKGVDVLLRALAQLDTAPHGGRRDLSRRRRRRRPRRPARPARPGRLPSQATCRRT